MESGDYILNGQANGSVASALLANNFDVNSLRPYLGNDGRTYITRNQGGKNLAVPVANANASLLRLEWTELDQVVIRAALPRLRAVADVRGRGLQMTIPNGLAKTVLQTQAQSDVNAASISMDGLADGTADRPAYNLTNLPLPIIHKDFSFSARQIATSRNGAMPLDLSMAELAARRVAEGAEQLLLGVTSSYSYGGGTIYGFTNFPSRMTYSLTNPDLSASYTSWIPRMTVQDVLNMRYLSQQHHHYGPWVLYTSLAWDQYLDDDLNAVDANSSNITLRDRLRRIDGIEDVVTLDYLNGYDMVLVQMTTDVVREVVGMDITTIQWETHGGMQLNFKVMCILTPQLRADFLGNTGIVHGSVAGQTTQPLGAIYLPNGNP
jgi:uncharacterized linocin/CFP29 family protein